MGYAFVVSPCFGCGRVFSFSPSKVPSIRVNGQKEPVCANCVKRANPMRAANGLEPITVQPGAYDPDNESEVW